MKKVGLFVFAILLLSTISAIEFNVDETYPQHGTIITTISGSFQETLKKDDFSFYRGHVRVPMDFDLMKILDDYYLYVSLDDKEPGNYTIILEEVEYLRGAKVLEEDFERNFTITDQLADFSISKGFVMTEDDFAITIQNLQDKKITVTSEFTETKTTELYSGEIVKLDFAIADIELLNITNLRLTSNQTNYQIPVYVLGVPTQQEPIQFELDPQELNITLNINNQTNRTIFLKNTGNQTIFQLRLELSDELERYVFLSQDEFFNVSPEFIYPIQLSVYSFELPRTIEGELAAYSSGIKSSSNISLNFSVWYEGVDSSEESCSDLRGSLCAADKCSGQVFQTTDGSCCLGICEGATADGEGSSLAFLGWIILIIVIVGAGWLYFKKYRQAKGSPKGVEKFFEEKKKDKLLEKKNFKKLKI